MLTAVKGYYEGGQIFFKEEPPVTERTDVIVTFLTEEKKEARRKGCWAGFKASVLFPMILMNRSKN